MYIPASSKRCTFSVFFRDNCVSSKMHLFLAVSNCMFVRNEYIFMFLKRHFYLTKRCFFPTVFLWHFVKFGKRFFLQKKWAETTFQTKQTFCKPGSSRYDNLALWPPDCCLPVWFVACWPCSWIIDICHWLTTAIYSLIYYIYKWIAPTGNS